MTLKGILFGAVAASGLLLATSAARPHSAASTGLQVADVLPKMKSLITSQASTSAQKRYTLIHFWAAYDAQSRAQNVVWDHYFAATPQSVVAFQGVSLDPDEQVYRYTLALDQVATATQQCVPQSARAESLLAYGLSEGFHSYLLDERGVVLAVDPTPDKLEQLLK